MKRFLLAAAFAAACQPPGTLSVELVVPGGTLPAGATQVRVDLDTPPFTQTTNLDTDGSFEIDTELDATAAAGRLTVTLLDRAGVALAHGVSPPLDLAGDDGLVRIFVAPRGFSPAPFDWPALADVAVAQLSYGALFAGGRDAQGTKTSGVIIYSVYSQEIVDGSPMPGARSGQVAAASALNLVALYGGLGSGDTPAGDLWEFDTNVPPAGGYIPVPTFPALARAGAVAAPLGADKYLVTGSPPAILDIDAGNLTAITNAPAGAAAATVAVSTTTAGGTAAVILAGPTGIFRYDAAAASFSQLDATPRAGAAVTALADGRVLVAFAGGTTLVTSDGILTPGPAIAFRDRAAAALAGTTVVVAGGFDFGGAARADADLIDANLNVSLVPMASPRGAPAAVGLANQTVLVLGGRASDGGAPQGGAEILTP